LPLRACGCEGCYDRGQDEGCGDEADVHGDEADGGRSARISLTQV
jgi:hypothetical protein